MNYTVNLINETVEHFHFTAFGVRGLKTALNNIVLVALAAVGTEQRVCAKSIASATTGQMGVGAIPGVGRLLVLFER